MLVHLPSRDTIEKPRRAATRPTPPPSPRGGIQTTYGTEDVPKPLTSTRRSRRFSNTGGSRGGPWSVQPRRPHGHGHRRRAQPPLGGVLPQDRGGLQLRAVLGRGGRRFVGVLRTRYFFLFPVPCRRGWHRLSIKSLIYVADNLYVDKRDRCVCWLNKILGQLWGAADTGSPEYALCAIFFLFPAPCHRVCIGGASSR